MARTVLVAPNPKLFDEYEMPASAAHKARIYFLQMLVKEQPVERYANVPQKRRFRAAFDDVARMKIERNVAFKGKALEPFGRVDLLRDGNLENAIVVECNEQVFDKGIAQMVLVAETALLERLEKDPQMDEHIYGVVSDLLMWQVMEVGAEGARFCKLQWMKTRKRMVSAVLSEPCCSTPGKEARDV
ncbi:hypothetical protein GQ600_17374 [Phytophthora cactorum]|nr:hypothetical protein GQ600_17374 [Phytophthora cactorum]